MMGDEDKKMKEVITSRIPWKIPLLITICLVYFSAQAKYSGGNGTANDPYQIITSENIILLGGSPSDYNKSFILTANIDLSGFSYDTALIVPDTKGAR